MCASGGGASRRGAARELSGPSHALRGGRRRVTEVTRTELRPNHDPTAAEPVRHFHQGLKKVGGNFKRDHLDIMWPLTQLREKGEVASPSNRDRLPNDGICRLKNLWGLSLRIRLWRWTGGRGEPPRVGIGAVLPGCASTTNEDA